MSTQIENLKQELREFLELSKMITEREWEPSQETVWSGGVRVCAYTEELDADFIARSRNISPAMAECLLVAVEGLEMIAFIQENQVTTHAYASNRDLSFNGRNAFDKLQQIITIWEASK
jgi:hypothetical protein